jgi:hypothetical protein
MVSRARYGQQVDSSHSSSPAFSILPILNESTEKRWSGDSSFVASSERVAILAPEMHRMANHGRQLSKMEPRLRVSHPRSGLPGTDDQPWSDDSPRTVFIDPVSCGFPPKEQGLAFLQAFLSGVHCVFSFLHAVTGLGPSRPGRYR